MIHEICKAKLWLSFKNNWKESSNICTTWKVFTELLQNIPLKLRCKRLKSFWQSEKSENEFCWVLLIRPHDLSHLVGIVCLYFSRNPLLSFLLRHDLKWWSSGQDAGSPIQVFYIQNHWMAPRLTQPFIRLRSMKLVPGLSGNLVVKSKLPPQSGSTALR